MLPTPVLHIQCMVASQSGSGIVGWGESVGREDWLPGAIAALGIAMITTVLLRRWLKRTKAASKASQAPLKEQRERLQGRAERDSLDRLMVEVQELTRVCAAQIENRASKLEYLIELADQRLKALELACESADDQTRSTQPRLSSAGRSQTSAMASARVASGDWSSPADRDGQARGHSPADHLSRQVHELSQMGLKSIEIARQLDEQVGKVELILALRDAS